MAFTSTITGTKQLGGAQLIYGTWDGTAVTEGNIVFAGQRGAVALTTTTATNTTLTTSGSYVTSGVSPGDIVTGTGIPVGTFVASVESATSLTLNQAATDATATSRTFTRLIPGIRSIINAKAISSTSATTMTACKVTANNALALNFASGDAGWWSVTCE